MKRIAALFLCLCMIPGLLYGCAEVQQKAEASLNEWVPTHSMELEYAEQFSVDYYEGGYKLITVADKDHFLVIPEGGVMPESLPEDVAILQQPIENIYLAATSAMGLFDAMDRLDALRLSGTRVENWYIENARRAMEDGSILYAGKYSEPDYELILSEGCGLAIESTMIGFASDVKAKLEELGIPVLVDYSSYESHPLGRTEWIKLYAALINEEEKAEALFEKQSSVLDGLTGLDSTGKTVAFFHISSSGYVIARKSGDYVSRMIELAGGEYVFSDLGDPSTANATVTVEMEQFYATAKDADYIIYNSTIGGELESLDELIGINELLRDFKAVQNGKVWCTGQNMFQQTMELGQMIGEFHTMLTASDAELEYLYKLE